MQSCNFILETFICCYEFITDFHFCTQTTEIQPFFRLELYHFNRNYFWNTFHKAARVYTNERQTFAAYFYRNSVVMAEKKKKVM